MDQNCVDALTKFFCAPRPLRVRCTICDQENRSPSTRRRALHAHSACFFMQLCGEHHQQQCKNKELNEKISKRAARRRQALSPVFVVESKFVRAEFYLYNALSSRRHRRRRGSGVWRLRASFLEGLAKAQILTRNA